MIWIRSWRDVLIGLAALLLLTLAAAGVVASVWVITQGVGG